MTRPVENTSIFPAHSAGRACSAKGRSGMGVPSRLNPHTSRINTTLTNLSSSTTSTSTLTNHHHTQNPQDSPTIHHHQLGFSTSHAEKQSLQLSDHSTWVGGYPVPRRNTHAHPLKRIGNHGSLGGEWYSLGHAGLGIPNMRVHKPGQKHQGTHPRTSRMKLP